MARRKLHFILCAQILFCVTLIHRSPAWAISIKLQPLAASKKSPQKSQPEPAKKTIATNTKKTRFPSEAPLWNVRLMILPSQIPVATGAAVSIDKDWLIVRLEEPPTLASLEATSAILINRGTLQIWAELKDIELEHGWALAYSKSHSPAAAPTGWEMLRPKYRNFGFQTEDHLKDSWSSFQKLHSSLPSRTPSAIGNLKSNIERRWIDQSNLFSAKFRNSRRNLSIGQFSFGPIPTSSHCKITSTIIKDTNISKKVSGGSALVCNGKENEESPFSPQYQVQVGSLKLLPASAKEPDGAILNSLAESWKETFTADSSQVASSTSPFCTTVQIANNGQYLSSCVRGLRPLSDIFDSLFVLGQRTGNQFHYTLLRLNGFGSNSSKEILNYYMHSMEEGSR